uniref:Metalloendopeptidase n=1 Tax=Strongyloides papillosus TaxID=174720 RepID=A0A0N5B206_STREA
MIFILLLFVLSNLTFAIDLENSLLENNSLIERKKRAILRRKHYIWREKEITYFVSETLNNHLIKRALSRISTETCLIFKRVYNRRDALFLYLPGSIYETNLGRRKEIPHKVYLPELNEDIRKILRGTLRALGVDYEHNRYDRDKYTKIDEKLINHKFMKNFKKNFRGSATTYGTSYDYRSIMHFSESECGNSGRVIKPKDKLMQAFMGKSEYLTFYDAKVLNKVYCNYPRIRHPRCRNYSYQSPRLPSQCRCPSFVHGPDCRTPLVNHNLCTRRNRLFARKERNIAFLKVGGRCIFYIYTEHHKKIRMKLSYFDNNIRNHTCTERNSIEVKYRNDLGVSGVLYCPSQNSLEVVSHGHIILLQSRLPAREIKIKVEYWRV